MSRRDAALGLGAAGLVVLALMTVFAIELSDTQAKSKQDVQSRVHERAVLAGALIESLFQSVQQQIPQDARRFGTKTVSARTIDRLGPGTYFQVLLGPDGRVIAYSRGFTAQARADLSLSAALALTRAGHPYALGNVVPYGSTGALEFALRLPTPYGIRTLLSGSPAQELSAVFNADLRKIPGVRGAHNYLIDGSYRVLASTNRATPPGYVFRSEVALRALGRASGDVDGRYYTQVHIPGSTWRIVLSAPDGPLYASISGPRKWVPWLIFACFALFALAALVLGRRALRSAAQVRETSARLAVVNHELEESNAALERRARELARSNAELEQFASIASHDLQEPLRKVRTFTGQVALLESEHLSDRGRDYLQRANGAAERMQKLIEDLLKYSRVATHGRPFAPVDLAQVTSEVLEDLADQVERSGAVVHVGALPTISADALQMRQLLQNLISNALKFRREGVTPEVSIEGTVLGDRVHLVVSDNGIGFEPQYSRRIFRVFERLHGRGDYPGTGIGLALCRRIAERHGGAVMADSEPGEGATFTVTLPTAQRDEVLVVPELDANEEEARVHATIAR